MAKPSPAASPRGSSGGISAARGLFKTLSYDPINDFAGITVFNEGTLLLVAGPEEKGIPIPQLIAKIRANPIKYSLGGPNVTSQVFHKLFTNATKADITYVPYKDSGQMVADLIPALKLFTMKNTEYAQVRNAIYDEKNTWWNQHT